MEAMRVLLVDDHILFRKGVASLLSSRKGISVIGEAGDGCEAIDKARETFPDVILMDVHMPHCDGLQAVRAIKREMPNVKILMVTVDEEDEVLFEAIKSGAQGYVLKKLEPQRLFAMIESAARGEVALVPSMMAKILNEFRKPATDADESVQVRENLTSREMDVLEQVVRGASNKEIAEVLHITENTVKKHLQSILAKLHLQNRIQAAVYAVREGLLNNGSDAP